MYTTVPRFFSRYPRLQKTNVSSETMATWLIAASNYIDGYIGGIVPTIPVSPSPPILTDLCEDLAHVMFLRRNTLETGKDTSIDKMWSEAINRLENMRAGTFLIYSGSGTVISLTQRNQPPWSSVGAYTPTFGLSDIEDSVVDPDRKDDEEDARDTYKVSVRARTPKMDELRKKLTPAGRKVAMENVGIELENEVKDNIESGGRKPWAKWKALAYSTKYKKKVFGGSMKPLAGLTRKVGHRSTSASADVFVKGKIAKFQHEGTPKRAIFAKNIGEGGKPLFFPFHKGRINYRGYKWFKGWMVENHSIPARPLVPDAERAGRIGARVLKKFIGV